MMSKRGLNSIITTVLIILLVLVAIALVWYYFRTVVKTSSESVTSEQYTTSFSFVVQGIRLDETNKKIIVLVKRESGGISPKKITFVVSDSSAQTKAFTYPITGEFRELETQSFEIIYGTSIGRPLKIAVAGVFELNNHEVTGPFTDNYQFVSQLSSNAICGNAIREGAEQCDDGDQQSGDGCSSSCQNERFNITIVSPTQGTYNSLSPSLNYSIIDEGRALAHCWYTLDRGVSNVTLVNCANSTLSLTEGSIHLVVYADTSYGRETSATVDFSVDLGAPGIVLVAPAQNAVTNIPQISFSYTPSGLVGGSCSLWGNFNGSYSRNQTDTTITNGIPNTFYLSTSEGTFLWAVSCSNGGGQSAITPNRTIIVDRTPPTLVVSSPLAQTYPASSVPIQATVSEPGVVWGELREEGQQPTSITLTSSNQRDYSATLSGLNEGVGYQLFLYANDSANNIYQHPRIDFDIDLPENCVLNQARWEVLDAVEGELVDTIIAASNCQEEPFVIKIYESDIGPDDFMGSISPLFSDSTEIIAQWNTQWNCDGNSFGVCLFGDPEYYFVIESLATQGLSLSSPDDAQQWLTVHQASPDCGNGFIQPGEQCDDSNQQSGDGCSSSCTLENGWYCANEPSECQTLCRDGIRAGTEACDEGSNNGQSCAPPYDGSCSYCSSSCTLISVPGGYCDDGIQNGPEQCDNGNQNGVLCSASYGGSCQYCDDSCFIQTILGPSCGDAQCSNGETCSSCSADCGSCANPCGNGVCSNGETCSSCSADCGSCAAQCGNGQVESGEVCELGQERTISCAGQNQCQTCIACTTWSGCGYCGGGPGPGTCNNNNLCESGESTQCQDCQILPAGGGGGLGGIF